VASPPAQGSRERASATVPALARVGIGRWILERSVPYLVAVLYYLYSRTWRLEVTGAADSLARFIAARQPVLFAHWHGEELVLMPFYAFKRLAVLTSLSSDGELMTRALRCLGYRVFRGSSSRGGARGLLALIHDVGDGSQASLAVDGPHGPLHEVKPGIAELAFRTGAPVVAARVWAQSAWFVPRTWNRSFVPKPFSRVRVAFSPPIPYERPQGRDASRRDAAVEGLCRAIKEQLEDLGRTGPTVA
jgi:hypothetical protein